MNLPNMHILADRYYANSIKKWIFRPVNLNVLLEKKDRKNVKVHGTSTKTK